MTYIFNENGEARKTIESVYYEEVLSDAPCYYDEGEEDRYIRDHPYNYWDVAFMESIRGERSFETMENHIGAYGK